MHKIVGHTKSKKSVYVSDDVDSYEDSHYNNFTCEDFMDAIKIHEKYFIKYNNARKAILKQQSWTKDDLKRKKLLNYMAHLHYSEITSLSQRKNFTKCVGGDNPYMTVNYKEKLGRRTS